MEFIALISVVVPGFTTPLNTISLGYVVEEAGLVMKYLRIQE